MLKEFVYTILIAAGAIVVNTYWEKQEISRGEPVTVTSVFGRLQGITGLTRGGRTIYKFTSIPYAKPPVGNLRFEPPVKYGKWKGRLDATKPAATCAQYDILMGKFEGQEDCLFLNVYTPHLPKTSRSQNELLPVMVFIYGGHFMFGSHRFYSPDYLLDEDVVLVTLNYRVNSLGFLNTGDSTATGNQGLKDQVVALKWVKEAIADFGGNPNLVTLFGNSAGGASVSFHMLSNMSRGLFHRAISQSGSSLSPILFTRDPKKQAIRLGNKVSCPTKESQELVACLRRLPVEYLIRVHEETYDAFCETDAIFAPSIEQVTPDNDIFLSESPTKLLAEGNFLKIPWISGVTQDEGCFRTPLIVNNAEKLHSLNHNWTSISTKTLVLQSPQPEVTAMKIRQEYFPPDANSFPVSADHNTPIRLITKGDITNISNLFGDRFFAESCSQEGNYHSRHAPVYLYYFTKKAEIGYGYILDATRGVFPAELGILVKYLKALVYLKLGWTIDNYGVCHTDELPFLFKLSPELGTPTTSPNFAFSESLVKLWVSFAKNGKPDLFEGVEWTTAGDNNGDATMRYLEIGNQPKMISEPFTARIKFWRSLSLTPN